MEKLYTCAEIAERYSVKVDTVWEWIRNGSIPAVQIGRVYRVRESDLLAFEQKRMINGAGEATTD